jgi:pimeloyl-ACP methyl ester carboxylesterase
MRYVLTAVAVLTVALAAFIGFALRDQPGREAAGRSLLADAPGRVPIEYFDAGPAGAATVVLLPSFGRGAADFNELVAALNGAGFRTLAVQFRGAGHSELGLRPADLFDYAEDVRLVLENAGVDAPASFIGHAFGNRIARSFATRHPDAVDKLVLISSGESPPRPDIAEAISTGLFPIASKATRREAISRAFFAEGHPVPEHWLRGWFPRAALAQTLAIQRTNPDDWREAGGLRLLVIQPSEDAASPGAGEELQQLLGPKVTLVELPGAGHAALPEQPQMLAAIILQYLTNQG